MQLPSSVWEGRQSFLCQGLACTPDPYRSALRIDTHRRHLAVPRTKAIKRSSSYTQEGYYFITSHDGLRHGCDIGGEERRWGEPRLHPASRELRRQDAGMRTGRGVKCVARRPSLAPAVLGTPLRLAAPPLQGLQRKRGAPDCPQ
jgi:hypothetical protein